MADFTNISSLGPGPRSPITSSSRTPWSKSNWRIALEGCSVLAAVATPSNDAPTMLAMAVPLCLLYVASIYLVAFVEKLRARHAYRPSYDTT